MNVPKGEEEERTRLELDDTGMHENMAVQHSTSR